MAFPTEPLDVMVELQNIVTAGVWTDITSEVYTRGGGIQIGRGRQDEATSLQPGWAQFTLNNRDGRFSPRNPTGTYYGKIGRNTPIRVSALVGPTRLLSTSGAWMQAPDTAGLSIVGDIDLRVDMRLTSWAVAGRRLSKWATAGDQRSYSLDSTTNAEPVLYWSTDGATELSATATVPLPQTAGRQTVRATLDVDNGAAGCTVTFYTGTSVDGPWTQLGEPVVQSGTTSIFDSTAALIGPQIDGAEVYALRVLQGIGGTERANPDFAGQAEGATSFADDAGNTWVQAGSPSITARRYRFYGEVSSWPQSWDVSGNDVWVPVEAAGVLRRLGQGATALKGPVYRATINDANMRAYWPMEDAEGSTSMASALPGGSPLAIAGSPMLASSTVFAATEALPELAGGSFSGAVNAYAATGTIHARCLMANPAAGDTNGAVIMRVFTTGTAARWDYVYTTGGNLTLNAYDSPGTTILSQPVVGFNNDGELQALVLELVQNGADIDYKMLTISTVDNVGLQFTSTLAGHTVGAASAIQLNPGGDLDETVLGHLAVSSAIPVSVQNPLRGWAGETAGRRAERLCAEESIDFTAYGDLDEAVAMGAQKPARLLDLLAECEETDLGQVFESREGLGLAYRTRDSRQYQSAALAMAYGDLSELVPVEDDQGTRNDVTVSRIDGSSARITVTTGPLSTQAPPNGVGLYDESISLSLYTDAQPAHHAQWRATEGTVDEARYPEIRARLETRPFATSATLTDQTLSVEHGDLLTVTGAPAWLPPDTIKQHTVGQIERLGVYAYDISFVCVPAGPTGSVGLLDDPETRLDSETTTLAEDLTTTETDVDVAIESGSALWVTTAANPAEFPFDVVVGGEVMTVTACTGTSSPQTFTVTRSVNGVVKTHAAGAQVRLARPVFLAL